MEENQGNKKLWITIIIVSTIIIGICLSILIARALSKANFNDSVQKIEKSIKTAFPGTNSIEVSGHTIKIKVWIDGIFDASKEAATGNKVALKQWDEIKDNMYLTISDMCDSFFWVDDEILYFNLVSDLNHDQELLVFKNKSIIYDGVYDHINKYGG